MAQRTSSVNEKWRVKISIDRKKKKPTAVRKLTPRRVTIQKQNRTNEHSQQSQVCNLDALFFFTYLLNQCVFDLSVRRLAAKD